MNTEPIADTVDAFRDRERETWKKFLASGTVEDLLAHQAALRALNGEIETRVQMMLEHGRIQTSGRKAVTT